MKNKLLILGAGQFGAMVMELSKETGLYEKIDFLDDSSPMAIGKLSDYSELVGEYDSAIVAIGNPDVREKLCIGLKSAGFDLANIISKYAYVSPSAILDEGIIIEPMAVVQKGSSVGRGVIISSGAVLRHDSGVSDYCHCDCNSVVMSNSTVPKGTKVMCLSIFKNN